MNINLARQVQQSILDQTKPFDMNSWDHCIAGHCVQTLKAQNEFRPIQMEAWGPCAYASRALGITYHEGRDLFTFSYGWDRADRVKATERLEQLIRSYEALEGAVEGTSVRGKAPLRSPRATLRIQQAAEPPSIYWHNLPPTVVVDFTAVNNILREAAQQIEEHEPELAQV